MSGCGCDDAGLESVFAGIWGIAGGEVVCRGRLGLFCEVFGVSFFKLPDDVVDRNCEVLFVPILVNPATVPLANVLKDLLLLLVVKPVEEAEWW